MVESYGSVRICQEARSWCTWQLSCQSSCRRSRRLLATVGLAVYRAIACRNKLQRVTEQRLGSTAFSTLVFPLSPSSHGRQLG